MHQNQDDELNLDTFAILDQKYLGRILSCKVPFFQENLTFYDGHRPEDWEVLGEGPDIPEETFLELLKDIVALRRNVVETYVKEYPEFKYIEVRLGYLKIQYKDPALNEQLNSQMEAPKISLPDEPDFLKSLKPTEKRID